MTFRQQLLSSSNCCLLSSARGRHREQQIVVHMAQLVGPLVSVHDTLTLLSDLDCLANPPCSLVWLTGDDRSLVPVNGCFKILMFNFNVYINRWGFSSLFTYLLMRILFSLIVYVWPVHSSLHWHITFGQFSGFQLLDKYITRQTHEKNDVDGYCRFHAVFLPSVEV